MKKSRLEPPHIKHEIAKRLATGESQGSIARSMGICHTTVSRFSHREDMKKLIEEETMKLLEVVPDAVENIKTLVREMGKLPRKDHKGRALSYKASQKVLEGTGILNTHVQSLMVTNIINRQTNILSPVILELMKKHFGDIVSIPDDDIPDGEIFYTLKEAQVLIEEWRLQYNTFRPHSSLKYCSPAPEAWLH